MFEGIIKFFKGLGKQSDEKTKDSAKERLHLVLTQDRANVSVDYLTLMKQEIIEVIKKYIDIDEGAIDVRLTNEVNGDGTTGAPTLSASIPIISVKDETKQPIVEDKVEAGSVVLSEEIKSEENQKNELPEEKNNTEDLNSDETKQDESDKQTVENTESAEEKNDQDEKQEN